jgi:hypothetical protein
MAHECAKSRHTDWYSASARSRARSNAVVLTPTMGIMIVRPYAPFEIYMRSWASDMAQKPHR